MLSNLQKAKFKCAQRQIGLTDSEYREMLMQTLGTDSSTDPRLGDEHFDKMMKDFEADYWHKVDTHQVKGPLFFRQRGDSEFSLPFLQRGYWKNKNTRQETSRDRYTETNLEGDIAHLESELMQLDCNRAYLAAIKSKVTRGSTCRDALFKYKAALTRTLEYRKKKMGVEEPF